MASSLLSRAYMKKDPSQWELQIICKNIVFPYFIF